MNNRMKVLSGVLVQISNLATGSISFWNALSRASLLGLTTEESQNLYKQWTGLMGRYTETSTNVLLLLADFPPADQTCKTLQAKSTNF